MIISHESAEIFPETNKTNVLLDIDILESSV